MFDHKQWVGEGALIFPEAPGEKLEMLRPIKGGRGSSFSRLFSDSEILAELTAGDPRQK